MKTRKQTKIISKRMAQHVRQLLEAGNSIAEASRKSGATRAQASRIADDFRKNGGVVHDGRKGSKSTPAVPSAKAIIDAAHAREHLKTVAKAGVGGHVNVEVDSGGITRITPRDILAFDIGDDVLFKVPKTARLEDVFTSIARAFHKLGVHT